MVFLVPETGEVGVTKAIDGKISGGTHDESFVASLSEVSDDGLDCFGVRLSWVMGEASALIYGKGDVGATVSGEIKEHADH